MKKVLEKLKSFPDALKILNRAIEKNYFIIHSQQDSYSFHPLC